MDKAIPTTAKTETLEDLDLLLVSIDERVCKCPVPVPAILTISLELEPAGRTEQQAGHQVVFGE